MWDNKSEFIVDNYKDKNGLKKNQSNKYLPK
jgi:hypothetical protein